MVLAVSRKASPTPRYSGSCYPIKNYIYGDITLYVLPFQVIQLLFYIHVAVLQPRKCRNIFGLGSSHFARRYSGNHYYFLFLRLLRCFSSAGYPVFQLIGRVSPFGNLRIKTPWRFPTAYRSLARPSSSLRA